MTIMELIHDKRSVIKSHLSDLMLQAVLNQRCQRKAVACYTLLRRADALLPIAHAFNGPTDGHTCTVEIGNCGCGHAEPRAIFRSLEVTDARDLILVCEYSPCTSCAHAIIASQRVKTVVYRILTEHDQRGIKLLEGAGIQVVKL